MPLKSGSSPAVVSENIKEFDKGPSFAHTSDKFGKDRANKQAVAVALHSADKSKDGKGEDHKAAVAKMHPDHVHKLVMDAHAGKYGPQAQQVAQQATQPQQGAMPSQGDDGDADDMTQSSRSSSMFSSGGASPAAPPQPPNRASMFQGGR